MTKLINGATNCLNFSERLYKSVIAIAKPITAAATIANGLICNAVMNPKNMDFNLLNRLITRISDPKDNNAVTRPFTIDTSGFADLLIPSKDLAIEFKTPWTFSAPIVLSRKALIEAVAEPSASTATF